MLRGKASYTRRMLIDPWKFRGWKQVEVYEKLIYKTRAIKLDTLCHSGRHGRGVWKKSGRKSGRVAACSSIFQQGRVLPGTGLGCGEALLGSKSTQPSSALWENLAASASLLLEDQSCIQGLATGTIDRMFRSGTLMLSPWGGEVSGTSYHISGLISSPKNDEARQHGP